MILAVLLSTVLSRRQKRDVVRSERRGKSSLTWPELFTNKPLSSKTSREKSDRSKDGLNQPARNAEHIHSHIQVFSCLSKTIRSRS